MQNDHLQHWSAIAAHLGIKPDAARHLARTAGLPTFKLGTKTVAASRRAIDAWLAEREGGDSLSVVTSLAGSGPCTLQTEAITALAAERDAWKARAEKAERALAKGGH